ncbi:MAG: DUF2807 domain-containing protein [Bacteroidaceae bacterium]|nr:DUF2807 domain-containing protein [Bacteroidaceae bacterium]
MKKMMILVCAIMMVATANAKRVETTSFNEVRVNVPARVRIVAGETYSVNIVAENKYLTDAVKVTVKDGVLAINSNGIESLGNEGEELCITIVTPCEPKLSASRDMETKVLRNTFDAKKDLALDK